MRKILALAITTALIVSIPTAFSATPKVGGLCAKINQVYESKSTLLVCATAKGKRTWRKATSVERSLYLNEKRRIAAEAAEKARKESIEALATKAAADTAAARIAADAAIAKAAADAAIAKAAAETAAAKAAAVTEAKAILDKAALEKALTMCPSKPQWLKVGIAYNTGGREDSGINSSVARGVDWLKACGVEVIEVYPTTGADIERENILQSLKTANCNPIIAVGFLYAGPLKKVAAHGGSLRYAILDDASVDLLNVTSLVFASEQGAYLAGVAAAYATRTGKVGFIGGIDIPLIKKRELAFIAGVKDTNSKLIVEAGYVTKFPDFSGFNDPIKAKTIAAAMIKSGIDVIYASASASNQGVFAAAAAATSKTWTIGDEFDQYYTASDSEKENMLTSVLKNFDKATFDFVRKISIGEYWREQIDFSTYGHTFNLLDEGVSLSITGGYMKDYLASIEWAKSGYKP
jgi:basic membrane protein A and related proteins